MYLKAYILLSVQIMFSQKEYPKFNSSFHQLSSPLCQVYYLVSTRYVFKAAPIVGPAVRSYLIDKAISMTFRVFNTTRPKKVVAAETVALASS